MNAISPETIRPFYVERNIVLPIIRDQRKERSVRRIDRPVRFGDKSLYARLNRQFSLAQAQVNHAALLKDLQLHSEDQKLKQGIKKIAVKQLKEYDFIRPNQAKIDLLTAKQAIYRLMKHQCTKSASCRRCEQNNQVFRQFSAAELYQSFANSTNETKKVILENIKQLLISRQNQQGADQDESWRILIEKADPQSIKKLIQIYQRQQQIQTKNRKKTEAEQTQVQKLYQASFTERLDKNSIRGSSQDILAQRISDNVTERLNKSNRSSKHQKSSDQESQTNNLFEIERRNSFNQKKAGKSRQYNSNNKFAKRQQAKQKADNILQEDQDVDSNGAQFPMKRDKLDPSRTQKYHRQKELNNEDISQAKKTIRETKGSKDKDYSNNQLLRGGKKTPYGQNSAQYTVSKSHKKELQSKGKANKLSKGISAEEANRLKAQERENRDRSEIFQMSEKGLIVVKHQLSVLAESKGQQAIQFLQTFLSEIQFQKQSAKNRLAGIQSEEALFVEQVNEQLEDFVERVFIPKHSFQVAGLYGAESIQDYDRSIGIEGGVTMIENYRPKKGLNWDSQPKIQTPFNKSLAQKGVGSAEEIHLSPEKSSSQGSDSQRQNENELY